LFGRGFDSLQLHKGNTHPMERPESKKFRPFILCLRIF
jgi:hypothetical protein